MIKTTPIKHLCNKQTPTIQMDEPIDKALDLFEHTKSSAVVVLDNTSMPIGILTERDITKHVDQWNEMISKPVSEIMSSPLLTLTEETDFRDAYIQISEHGFRHLVVVNDEGQLSGVLSEGDFLKHLTPEQLLAVKEVHLVMSKTVTTVSEDETTTQTISMMNRQKISSVIIIKDEKPIGIFTERDAVHLARKQDIDLSLPIHKYMISPVRAIPEMYSVLKAEEILEQENIRRLVVVDDAGRLSGILTQHDLVKGISGIYVEMLRDTIRKQTDIIYDTYSQLEDQSVLNNILNSFSDKLIIACDRNSMVQFSNATIFKGLYTVPDKGEILDHNLSGFDPTIASSIVNEEIDTIINTTETIVAIDGTHHFFKTSYAPIFSDENLLQGFLFTAEDVTKEKNASQDLAQTKKNLEQSERRFRKIFDSAKDGILVADVESKKFYMGNQAISDMLGYSKDEIKMLGLMDIHPKNSIPLMVEEFEKLTKKEIPISKNLPTLRKDGTIFYVDISAEPIELDGKNFLLGIFHDITERKVYEKVLEEKNLLLEEHKQKLLQAQKIAKIGNWTLNIKTMNADWSDEMRQICGIDADVPVGPEFLSTTVFPEDWPQVHSSLMAAAYDGTPHHMEYRIKHQKDGDVRWIDCRGIRVNDKNGMQKLVGTFQDITEKKELEIKIVQSETLFRAIFEQAAVGVAQIDTETGDFIKINQTYADIVGQTTEEMLHINFMTLTHPDDLEEDLENMKRLKAGEIDNFSMRKRYFKPDGSIVWIRLNVSPLLWREKELQSHISIIQNITKQVHDENELNQYKNIISATTDLIVFIDQDYKYITVNDAYLSSREKTYDEVIGHTVSNVIGEENFDRIQPLLDKALSGETFTVSGEHMIGSASNTRYEEGRFYPYHNIGNNTVAVVVNIRDQTEAYLNKESLKESDRALSVLFSNLPGMVYHSKNTPDWPMDFVSSGVLGLTGYSEKEFVNGEINYVDLVHIDDQQRIFDEVQSAILNNEPFELQYRILTKSAQEKWVWEEGRAVLDDDDAVKGLEGYITDITDQKESSLALQRSEDILVDSQKLALVGSFEHDEDFQKVYWSKELFHIFGFDETQPIPSYEQFLERVHPDDRSLMTKQMELEFKQKSPQEYEIRYILPNGTKKFLLLTTKVAMVEYGQAIRGTVQDITLEREKEIALRSSDEKYRSLFDGINDAVFVHPYLKDGFKHFVEVNDIACQRLGYSKEELLNLSPMDITVKNDAVKDEIALFKNQLNEESPTTIAMIHITKSGVEIPVEISAKLIKISGDTFIMAMARDLTERKSIEKKLKEQENIMMIQSRQAAMGEMISMIAHQWRQPLSVVSMASNNLLLDIELDQLNENAVTEELTAIGEQVQYMSRTIDDFRNFFQRSKTLEKMHVNHFINEVLAIIGPALDDNEIEIDIECDPSLNMQTFKSELAQVLINILSNAKDAFKHQTEDKKIRISLETLKDEITFYISNNGPHIPDEILATIFEPYFTTKEKSGGTGIGLYMSKSIIEKHMGGTINVKNTDEGVEFSITIPSILEKGRNA